MSNSSDDVLEFVIVVLGVIGGMVAARLLALFIKWYWQL